MSRKIYISNDANLDASVIMETVKIIPTPSMGVEGENITFKRYLSAVAAYNQDIHHSEALIAGDPEVDMELVGTALQNLTSVYVSSAGQLMYAPPEIEEVILNPDGSERERRKPVDIEANVNDEFPLKWLGKKMPIADCCRKFFFGRTIQLKHVDGLTFDYLYKIASQIEADKAMVLVGTGKTGKDPLIFQANGRPCRGFLEGRTQDAKFKLFLHLSDLELKRPG
ncbi:MAG TPA: hypothetical protein EYQ77_08030 [Methylococcaceae bacterium]|nr:hypothetical protein [Methylococcaceae bacterium]